MDGRTSERLRSNRSIMGALDVNVVGGHARLVSK